MTLPKRNSEDIAIDAWLRVLSRAPGQVNAPRESDAELLPLPGNADTCLAITIDTIAEEIRAGLYRDPYTMGWVTIMATLSDLAAVGAEPLGVVVSASNPPESGRPFEQRAALGMEEACRSIGTHVLGGDTNATPEISLTACAVGTVPLREVLTRRGIGAGDAVYLTGRAGAGNAFAMARILGLTGDVSSEERYRPSARIEAGLALRGHAGACMDTSDGVLATLDQLMRLNGRGFAIDGDWPRFLCEDALEVSGRTGRPEWMMLWGPHGEYELVFTVPAGDAEEFEAGASGIGIDPVRIGTVQERAALTVELPSGRKLDLDMTPMAELSTAGPTDLNLLVERYEEIGRSQGLE